MAEREEARATWEAIAPSFAAARQRPWPVVERFLATLAPGSLVLDVGAGSGRHARAARALGHRAVAFDVARGFAPDVRADAAALPARDAACDAVLLVAVLGTMPRREDRVAALREARRALKPGGRLLATAWARGQARYVRARLGLGPWTWRGPGEVEAPWPTGLGSKARRYHLYTARELRRDLAEAGWAGPPRVRAARMAGRGLPDNHVVEARRR